jgi:hypothetical protein
MLYNERRPFKDRSEEEEGKEGGEKAMDIGRQGVSDSPLLTTGTPPAARSEFQKHRTMNGKRRGGCYIPALVVVTVRGEEQQLADVSIIKASLRPLSRIPLHLNLVFLLMFKDMINLDV